MAKKNLYNKLVENKDNYDDLLGSVVSDSKIKVWSIRIVLMLIPLIFLYLVAEKLF